jgi:chromosome segregation ATPase
MLLVETAIFYLLLGAAVAAAEYLRVAGDARLALGLQLVGACLFWPLFLPMLLSPVANDMNAATKKPEPNPGERDGLAAAISQVETELDAALNGLDGWAEDVLNSEQHRLEELRAAWKAQADRIRQIDHLLAEPSARADSLAEVAADVASARQSEKTRQENIRQLAMLRNRMHADLVGTLAWVRELVTMIHLAKFSGAPAARAEELVAQIAAAVQGLSEVSAWREQEHGTAHTHEMAASGRITA